MARFPRLVLAFLLLAASAVVSVGVSALPAAADEVAMGQGTTQVTLNPGGGSRGDGADGLSFSINSSSAQGSRGLSRAGQDSLWYRGTQQYCCTAGAPYLNVGGQVFGQAGAAAGLNNWTSLTLVSSSGSTAVQSLPATTGNGTAVVRYVATKNGLVYTMLRTVTYTYPNDYVTDSYEFTIPAGNTEAVKFYLGGDTAPGGSDQGYGVMLTSPVRSVISLNTSSQIQYGIREVSGSKTFNGATSQRYSTPYATVRSGGDIGFVATNATHDAGLMVQWNLGSTPGTQSASLQQFVNKQGTNLSAGFDRTFTTSGTPVILNMSIENTDLQPRASLGFTIDLPAGTTLAPGARTNSCGGTFAAADGATTVSLTGASVAATANCVLAVPVVATTYGTYSMSASNVTSVTGVTNNVGSSAFYVPLAPTYGTDPLATLTVGTSTAQSVASAGAPAPTYALTGGALPAGLSLNTETGALTGTPTSAGAYSFTVTATNSGGTASRTFTGTVERGTPGLSGSVGASAVSYGTAVTFTVGSLPAGAVGTVTYTSGDTTLCTVTLPATSCTGPSDLAPGSYPVTASYTGDANWLPRAETIGSFDVTAVASTVTGSLESSTATFGTGVTVSASVSPADATGTITVTAGNLTLCTLTLPTTTCTTPGTLPPGSHPIAVSYSGDTLRLPSTGEAGTLQVVRATPSPSDDNDYVGTFAEDTTFSLPGLPTAATGTVTVLVGDETLCSYVLGTDPESCDAGATLPAGEYTLTFVYSGDDNFEPVTTTSTLIVDRASTTIESTPTVDGVHGTAESVEVTGLPSDATGTVAVFDGEILLCSYDIEDADGCELPADLAAGSYELLVVYSGDDNFLGSSAGTTLEIARAAATLTTAETITTAFNTPAVFGVLGLPADATGTVTVVGGPAGTLCTFDVTEADSCTTDGTTPAGSWPVTLSWSGDGNYLPVEISTTFEVARDVTEISTAATAAGVYGEPAVIAVEGLPEDAAGDVTITTAGPDGPVTLCTFSAITSSGCALDPDLPAGTYTLTVTFLGDANYEPSSSTVTLTVARATVEITAQEEGFTAVYSDTATVTVDGLPEAATGTVTVTVGSLSCTYDVTVADSCELPTTGLNVSDTAYPVTLVYSGDDNFEGDTIASTLTITRGEAGVIVSVADAVYGTPTVLTISDLPSGATGTVTVRSGETELCTIDVATATTCALPADLAAGDYALTVTYSGDINFGSSSKEQSLSVARNGSTPVGSEATVTAVHGTAPVFTVTGLPADATGTVVVTSGEVVLCSIELPATSCSGPAGLAGGSYPVTMTWSGDDNYLGSSVDTTLQVTPEASTVTATAAVGGTTGSSTSFTVSGLPADATGTITVLSGGRVLCTITLPATTCTLPSDLAAGSYVLDVLYSGDVNYAPSATTSNLIVGSVPTGTTPTASSPTTAGPTTAAPATGLAYTGFDTADFVRISLLLLLIGSGALWATRRRATEG